MAHPAPATPFCPRCGAPAVWHPQTNQWGCDHCRQMLPAPAPIAQPPIAQPPIAQPPIAQQSMAPPGPPCPRCMTAATWYPQVNQWGCDRCQQPVIPPGMLRQQYTPANDAGAIILKVVIFIITVIIIVAVKVGMRSAFR